MARGNATTIILASAGAFLGFFGYFVYSTEAAERERVCMSMSGRIERGLDVLDADVQRARQHPEAWPEERHKLAATLLRLAESISLEPRPKDALFYDPREPEDTRSELQRKLALSPALAELAHAVDRLDDSPEDLTRFQEAAQGLAADFERARQYCSR